MVCHFMGRVKLIHVQLLGKSCMGKLQWSIDFIFLYVAIWSVLRVNKLNVTSFPLGLYASFSTRGYQFKTEVQCMEAMCFMLSKVISCKKNLVFAKGLHIRIWFRICKWYRLHNMISYNCILKGFCIRKWFCILKWFRICKWYRLQVEKHFISHTEKPYVLFKTAINL